MRIVQDLLHFLRDITTKIKRIIKRINPGEQRSSLFITPPHLNFKPLTNLIQITIENSCIFINYCEMSSTPQHWSININKN